MSDACCTASSDLPTFRILDVNEETTIPYHDVRTELKKAGTQIPSNDVWIAALCRQHSLPLVSRDRHFDLVSGIRRLNW
ncbi:MAG: PIN domain-containing protein [Candidatus Acidiferrales bacterium]